MSQITITGFVLPDYHGSGASATVKWYSNQDFLTSDGVFHSQQKPKGRVWYKSVPCTVSGANVTVPTTVFDSTTDSNKPLGTYTAAIFDANGAFVDYLFGGWFVPHYLGPSITWAQLVLANNPTIPNAAVPVFGYTQAEVSALVATKQDTLVSGSNIKTVNSTSLLGSGDIAISSGPTDEYIQDLVGTMFTGNTETGISADYQDSDGTIDLVVSAPNFSESTVSKTTASLANGATETGTITIGRQFIIKKVVADRYAEIRLYGDAAGRTADASRVFGDLSFIGTQSKYILGLLLTAATGLTWFMSPPATGENCDSPTAATIYYSIKNTSGSTSTVTVDFHVLILEA